MNGPDHYREAERLLALAATPAAKNVGLADARLLRALADADRRGAALPHLAYALGQPLSATEHRLHQLHQQGLVQQLDTNHWVATSPELSTWGPESPTSTHLLVAASGVHASLAVAAATVTGPTGLTGSTRLTGLWEKAVS